MKIKDTKSGGSSASSRNNALDSKDILVIIVAAGSGSRFGGDLPKQFQPLGGRPLLMHTVESFRSALGSARIVVVLSAGMRETWENLCREYKFISPAIVDGGSTRWQSVKNAIDASGSEADMILVHDGARPLVSGDVIHRVADAVADGMSAVVPGVAVTDSLRLVTSEGSTSVSRTPYRAVQTPQGFDGKLLREAYRLPFREDFTDDASVVESAGAYVHIVDGDTTNIKITHPLDIAIAELIMLRRGV